MSNIRTIEGARELRVIRRKRNVLIIDDASTGRTILEKIVHNLDSDLFVSCFDNAIDALEWLYVHNADLIITDY